MKRSIHAVFAGVMCAFMADVAAAASAITVDGVAQRWPWNNKIDITYTVSGGQNVAAGVYAKVVFTATVGGQTYTIDGMSDVVADSTDGQHTVAYELPAGLRATGCTMTAKLVSTDAPCGDDYMVVDLASGRITWEGLSGSQEASNARYNTDLYKTDKLVLRKYPAGSYFYSSTWRNTDRAFYAGVFPVTSAQYAKICGGSGDAKPKASVSWYDLRGADLWPHDAIPAVESDTGTFFQRLNFLTKRYFDLPTEQMSEIVVRDGSIETYAWGGAMDTNYIVCSENSGGGKVAVGSRLPNTKGIFDASGNVWEFCLDGDGEAAANPFVPKKIPTLGSTRAIRGGGSYGDSSASNWLYFTVSGRNGQTPTAAAPWTGFRVFHIVK